MNTILSLLYLGILGIAVWWFARHTNNNKQRDANFYRLSGHIDYLNKLKNDLEVIDQLMTDIQLCKPLEREKAIRIEWTSETGENHICDIWISGSNQASMDMLMLAEHEREDLRTSLLTELEKI